MKFAVCNEIFGDWPWAQGMSMAHAIGYRGLEVAPFTLGPSAQAISASQRRAYRQAAADHGLDVIGLHWLLAKTEGFHLTTSDRLTRDRTVIYLRQLIELCADLGGHIMVLGSPLQRNFEPPMTHDQAMDNAADALAQLGPALQSYGVQLAIEPLGPSEGNFLNHAHQAVELIRRLDVPDIALHLDVKAMSSEPMPIADNIRQHARWLRHFHANDPNRLGPGMGDVDQAPIFQALSDIHYDGWVSVEVFDYSPGVERILTESWACMQRCLAAGSPDRTAANNNA